MSANAKVSIWTRDRGTKVLGNIVMPVDQVQIVLASKTLRYKGSRYAVVSAETEIVEGSMGIQASAYLNWVHLQVDLVGETA